MEFNNQLALVTGAAQGIGKAIAESLVTLGARVACLDIQFDIANSNPKPSESINQQGESSTYTGFDEQLFYYGVDVSDYAAVCDVVTKVENQHGPIKYLVSAAGILRTGEITEIAPQDWHALFNVNTHGVFNICQLVAKKMRARSSGAIVVVSSNAASTARVNMGAYAASKAAIGQFARCLGLELAAHNVRCNIVAPGSTDTAMQRQLWLGSSGEEKTLTGSLDQYRLGIPLKRIATPETVSDAVVFLLSNRAKHITMETLTVDGGATLGR